MPLKALVLAIGLLVSALVVPTATAYETEPGAEITLDRVWRVGGGAGVEVAYTVSCPEAPESGALRALWAQTAPDAPHNYLEFWCYPDEPQRVILLLSSWNGPPGTEVTLTTTVTNWLFAPWEEGIPGAYRIQTTDTTTVKRGAFEPESWAEIDADLRLLRTRLTRDGGVRVVQRLTCDSGSFGVLQTDIAQRTDTGTLWASGSPGDGFVECDGQRQTFRYVLQPDGAFTPGKAIVQGWWQMCDEFCPRGVSSDEVRLRPRR
jgi:hypothetical protein